MNMISTVVGVSLLLVFCEACHYKHKTCTQFEALGDDFTVTFGRLDGCCSHGLQFITGATIKSTNTSEKPLPYNSTNFYVHFTENTTHGSHWYTLSYSYICDYPMAICSNCLCHQQDIKLHLRIADFSLKTVEDQHVAGDDIELLSSSGLSTNNITVRFQYSLIFNEDVGKIKVATCEANMTEPKFVGNWMIFRSNTTPFDCRLVILNATIEDSGYYESVGLLPNGGNGEYHYASSNFVELIVRVEESTLAPAALESSNINIFIAAMIATFIGIVIALVVIALIVRRKNRQNHHPYNPLPGPQPGRPVNQPHPGYGGIDGRVGGGMEGEEEESWRGEEGEEGGEVEESPRNISPDRSISADGSFNAPNTTNGRSADRQVPPHRGGGEEQALTAPLHLLAVQPEIPSDSSEESGDEPEQPVESDPQPVPPIPAPCAIATTLAASSESDSSLATGVPSETSSNGSNGSNSPVDYNLSTVKT